MRHNNNNNNLRVRYLRDILECVGQVARVELYSQNISKIPICFKWLKYIRATVLEVLMEGSYLLVLCSKRAKSPKNSKSTL